MKMLNNISRSQAVYRHNKISAADMQAGQYAFALAICREPGRSQEEIARELCLNKSTIARNLVYLEDKGYISRTPLASDKRQFSVYPTEKMLSVLPLVKEASLNWMQILSEGIPENELKTFESVLIRMEQRAKEVITNQEENK